LSELGLTYSEQVRAPAVAHMKPMLSLNHTYDLEELKAFDERVRRVIGEVFMKNIIIVILVIITRHNNQFNFSTNNSFSFSVYV
jgi:hypothetical protein